MCCLKCILINHIVAHSRESCWCSSMNILPSFLFSLFFFLLSCLFFLPFMVGFMVLEFLVVPIIYFIPTSHFQLPKSQPFLLKNSLFDGESVIQILHQKLLYFLLSKGNSFYKSLQELLFCTPKACLQAVGWAPAAPLLPSSCLCFLSLPLVTFVGLFLDDKQRSPTLCVNDCPIVLPLHLSLVFCLKRCWCCSTQSWFRHVSSTEKCNHVIINSLLQIEISFTVNNM